MRIIPNGAACVGCRICMLICANRHTGSMSSSRIRISDRDSLVGHDIEVCVHCDERACVAACPMDALSLDQNTGAIAVDADRCAGCGDCVEACPYNAIAIERDIAIVCDMCGGEPGCVSSCPAEALSLEDD